MGNRVYQLLQDSPYTVMKFGTNTLTRGNGDWINPQTIDRVTDAVEPLLAGGMNLFGISSAAASLGLERAGVRVRPKNDTQALQYYSFLGQSLLGRAWERSFARHGRTSGYIQIPPHIWENPIEREHFQRSTAYAHALDSIPVGNTADFYVSEELAANPNVPGIGYSDNDPLAALVAIHTRAKWLIFFTDEGNGGSGGGESKSGAIALAEKHGVKTAVFSIDELIGRG